MNQRWLLSRRALLGGLGLAGLSTLHGGRALGQTAPPPPKRLLIVHVPEGMWSGAPRPAVGGSTLGPLLAPLETYRDRVLVLNNLSMPSRDNGPGGDGHHRGVPHMFTGIEMADADNAGGPSVDQYIAQAVGADSTFGSLSAAVRIVYGDTNSRCIWSARSRGVSPEQNPWAVYTRVFRAATTPPPPTMTDPPYDMRRSALDYSLDEINRLSGRLSASDRERLSSYQDSLRAIERRLAMVPPPAMAGCTRPTLPAMTDPSAEDNYEAIGRLHMDLIVAAMQCGLTKVASLQWGNSNDQCRYPWLGGTRVGHDYAHNNDNCDPTNAMKQRITVFYAEQFRYLLERLYNTMEGTARMLDNTMVLWASEFGECNGHSPNNLMWMLMGNAGGYFRSGRVVDCRGASVNNLHVSLCNAMGANVSTASAMRPYTPVTSFGGAAYCTGPLADIQA
jgi:hypothetical protein